MTTTVADFMGAAPQRAAPVSGNTPWASRYAATIRQVFHNHAARAPRSLQRHLGPSEIGSECDRQVVGKLAGEPTTNHVSDPWPSIRGTALHSYAEEAFAAENSRTGLRWVTERRVTPWGFEEHPGTGDLYDGGELAVDDHKFLGPTTHAKIVRNGPPLHYVVQLLLYKRGFEALGLPVRRVVLLAYPATEASLDNLYVWERPASPADDELLDAVAARLAWRKQWAAALLAGLAVLNDVPATPSDDTCIFCPFWRPQAAHDGGVGCPGPRRGT